MYCHVNGKFLRGVITRLKSQELRGRPKMNQNEELFIHGTHLPDQEDQEDYQIKKASI